MIYLIAFPAEIQAMQLLEPYGYAHILPRPPGQSWDDYAWNGSNGMIGGSKIILDYRDGTITGPGGDQIPARIPVVETTYFWCCLIKAGRDDPLFDRFSGQPIIEIDETNTPSVPPKPSDYIERAYHLSFDPDTIKGISPVWAGMPDLGWPYDSAG